MKKWTVSILLAGAFCVWIQTARTARGATVRMADDTTIRGELISLNGEKLTIHRTSPAPTTQISVDTSDIAQVVFHEPQGRTTQQPNQENQGGVLSALGSIFGFSSTSDDDAPATPGPPSAQPPVLEVPASQPASVSLSGLRWRITLKSGDELHGHIKQWTDQKLTVSLDAPAGQAIEIPGDQLVELWCGRSASVAKAAAMKTDAGPEDIAFVEKDKNVVSVKGVALGISGDALRFRLGDEDRKISLGRLVGIVFANTTPGKQVDSVHQVVRLSSGDVFTGTWTAADKSAVSLQTTLGPTMRIQLALIDSIDFVGGRVAYLSDLKPAKVEQTPFFGRVIPFRLNRSLEDGPLTLSDGTYTKGIAVHSRCVLQYALAANFSRFQTKFGFEDPQGKLGRVSARVLGDGKVLYENPEARGDQKPASIDVDVSGMQTLTLEVDFGKGQDVDGRVAWANARLLRAKAPQ